MKKSTHFLSEEEQMRTGFERLFRRIRDHILITFVLLFTCSHWSWRCHDDSDWRCWNDSHFNPRVNLKKSWLNQWWVKYSTNTKKKKGLNWLHDLAGNRNTTRNNNFTINETYLSVSATGQQRATQKICRATHGLFRYTILLNCTIDHAWWIARMTATNSR